ncbi:MAG TPA: TatD family deoxyribonuclease [Spirochaetia bacterium]|nr:TatD family deoxyribonuclease [Spirochaetia bacterium]
MLYGDAHCHLLELEKKGVDCGPLLTELSAQHFSFLLDAGINDRSPDRRFSFRRFFPRLWFGIGFSPAFVAQPDWRTRWEPHLEKWAAHPHVVVIGEIGLDYYRDYGSRKEQRELFEGQLAFSVRHDLPVQIHNRDADGDLIAILSNFRDELRGVMHCFSSDQQVAGRLLDLGLLLSFAGNLTYPKADAIRDAARYTPLSRLLCETDSPYLAPQPVRGTINTPRQVIHQYAVLAELKKTDLRKFVHRVELNFRELFLKKKGDPREEHPS